MGHYLKAAVPKQGSGYRTKRCLCYKRSIENSKNIFHLLQQALDRITDKITVVDLEQILRQI